jgi:YVTN family beta-propeller protein
MKRLIFPAIVIVLAFLVLVPGRMAARKHVNYMTAVEDHPLHCTSCHFHMHKRSPMARFDYLKYLSPLNSAVSPDGKFLCVAAQDADNMIVVNLAKGEVVRKIKVGKKPHTVVISKDGTKAYVSNEWSDNVSVVDMGSLQVTDTLPTGNGPAGLSLSSDGAVLYSVNSYGSDLSVIDLTSGKEVNRLSTGNNPTGITMSPDGSTLYVTSRRANVGHYNDPMVSELTLVNDKTRRISRYIGMENAYLMENVAFTPTGDLAFVTLVRPKNKVPSIQVERGFMMTHGIGVIENKEDGRVFQLLTDEPNAFYPDPFGIKISADGKRAFITNSGVNTVTVVNVDSIRNLIATSTPEMLQAYADNLGISSRYIEARIPTGANPKGLALSPDGKTLYVAEHLEDRITAINTENLKIDRTYDLDGPRKISVTRKGRRLLNNAGHTFQNQYSCYTCHPDEHEDGLVYNMASKEMGRNMTNTQSLRDISDTPPFKWNGKNQTVFKQDGMRFSTVLTRTEPFSYSDLDAISSYIMTGIKYPPNLKYNPDGVLTEAQARGKKIFERKKDFRGIDIPENNRCVTCHPAPYYTNLKQVYVSTLALSDDSMMLDTPHLNNIYASPPYLHDGRAKTLEEIWTLYGKSEMHGVVNDLTKEQLNDLIEYLRSLRSPDYDTESKTKIHSASLNH